MCQKYCMHHQHDLSIYPRFVSSGMGCCIGFASWGALHGIMTSADDAASATPAALDFTLMTCVISLWSKLLPIHDITPVCRKLGY